MKKKRYIIDHIERFSFIIGDGLLRVFIGVQAGKISLTFFVYRVVKESV